MCSHYRLATPSGILQNAKNGAVCEINVAYFLAETAAVERAVKG
jgi:hypothetical protein